MRDRTRKQRTILRDTATQARLALLDAAKDPREPHLARAAHAACVTAATAPLKPLLQRRPRCDRHSVRITRIWLDAAIDAYYYRLPHSTPVEQSAWALIDALPDVRLSAGQLQRLRDQAEDAYVLTEYELKDGVAAALRAAKTYRKARRRRDPEPLNAALNELDTFQSAKDDDPTTWPFIDQVELRHRIEIERGLIRISGALGGTPHSRSAARQLEPWLAQTSATLETPLSLPALEVVCEEWRKKRAPYLGDGDAARVRITGVSHPPTS